MTSSLGYSSIAMPLDCVSKMLISTFRTLPFHERPPLLLHQVSVIGPGRAVTFQPGRLHDFERGLPVLFGHPAQRLALRSAAVHVVDHHGKARRDELPVAL